MAKLSEAVVGETELIVRERRVDVELLLRCHADLQLMLSPRIRDNLPIVNAVGEGPIADHCAEVVVRFVEEHVAAVL